MMNDESGVVGHNKACRTVASAANNLCCRFTEVMKACSAAQSRNRFNEKFAA